MEFAVTPVALPQGTVLGVAGEFDLATAPDFATAVEAALVGRPPVLVVDLTSTTFADSSACRALVLATRAGARAGAAVQVVCPRANAPVRRILDLVGLEAVTPVREHLAETPVGPASPPP